MSRRVWSGIAALGCVLVIAAIVLVPDDATPPKPAPPRPELDLSVELGRQIYHRSARVYATVTITNYGPTTAERLAVECDPTPTPTANGCAG